MDVSLALHPKINLFSDSGSHPPAKQFAIDAKRFEIYNAFVEPDTAHDRDAAKPLCFWKRPDQIRTGETEIPKGKLVLVPLSTDCMHLRHCAQSVMFHYLLGIRSGTTQNQGHLPLFDHQLRRMSWVAWALREEFQPGKDSSGNTDYHGTGVVHFHLVLTREMWEMSSFTNTSTFITLHFFRRPINEALPRQPSLKS